MANLEIEGKRMQRVLSIQSHVVRGKCGNASAAFPLELLGLEVDRLNTVQFSNHTGYGSWTGKMLETAEVASLLEGLRSKGWIQKYDVILSGYMRDKGICQVISDLVDEAGATWVCDPVLGDYPRGLYVPEDLVAVHRDISCKKATVLTPNQFEAECLTGVKITDEKSAWECISALHNLGPQKICITSTLMTEENGKYMIGLLSDNENSIRGKIRMPVLTDKRCVTKDNESGFVQFTGTGDMFAACLCAHSASLPFHQAVGCAIYAVKATLEATLDRCQGLTDLSKADLELNQIGARHKIMNSGSYDWTEFVKLL